MKRTTRCDVAVVGAGVFGAWTAYHLRQAGKQVILLDAHGPGNSRSSSGGESRILRMGYGPDALYTRYAARSLQLWKVLFRRSDVPLFHRTGMLWMTGAGDPWLRQTLKVLKAEGSKHEILTRRELRRRFPGFSLEDVDAAALEPDSGVIMARRSVQALVNQATGQGVEYRDEAMTEIVGRGRIEAVITDTGRRITANNFVFACGPWLPRIFPFLKKYIVSTRQEVFFFGARSTRAFAPPEMPCWYHHGDEAYGVPDLENRGVKIAFDRQGPPFDPENGCRLVGQESLSEIRRYLKKRIPALNDAPIVETRVCQYENTRNRDFLIDRHPELENCWIAGGGSGHGFKHGPAVGEYLTKLIVGRGSAEPRFSFAGHSQK